MKDETRMMLSETVAVVASKVSGVLLKRIQNDETFVDAMRILNVEQVKVDLTSPKLYQEKKNITVVFEIIDPNNFCDYKKVVCTSEDDELFTYFEERNSKFKYDPKCLSHWTDWADQATPTECRYNGWCWSNGKQATYKWRFRKKIKHNGQVVAWQYRLVKVRCGC